MHCSAGEEGQSKAGKAWEEAEEPFQCAASVERGVLSKFHSNISKSKASEHSWLFACVAL